MSMTAGKKPHLEFPLKNVLDGSEEIYTQVGGVLNKFTVQAVATFIAEGGSPVPFSIVANNAALPEGEAIDVNRIYIVKNWSGSGESESVVWDSDEEEWLPLDQEETDYIIVVNDAALPVEGDPKKIYHVLDNGIGKPIAKRWDTDIGDYIPLAPETSGGGNGLPFVEKIVAAGVNVEALGSSTGWNWTNVSGVGTLTVPADTKLLHISVVGEGADAVYEGGSFISAFKLRIISGSTALNQSNITSLMRNCFVINNQNASSISDDFPLTYDPGLVEVNVTEVSSGIFSIVFNNLNAYSGGWIIGF